MDNDLILHTYCINNHPFKVLFMYEKIIIRNPNCNYVFKKN